MNLEFSPILQGSLAGPFSFWKEEEEEEKEKEEQRRRKRKRKKKRRRSLLKASCPALLPLGSRTLAVLYSTGEGHMSSGCTASFVIDWPAVYLPKYGF